MSYIIVAVQYLGIFSTCLVEKLVVPDCPSTDDRWPGLVAEVGKRFDPGTAGT